MSHNITCIILKGEYDKDIALKYDLEGIDLGYNLTLFHADLYFSEYWQQELKLSGKLETLFVDEYHWPTDISLYIIVSRIAKSNDIDFAIIHTNYFGGAGYQLATVFKNDKIVSDKIISINEALKYLGVIAKDGIDEFETVRLNLIRDTPKYFRAKV